MILRKFILFIAIVMLSGCVFPTGKSKRRKAIKKLEQARRLDPSLFKNDTIVVRDTVIVEHAYHDTTTNIIFNDSVTVINNERMIVKYFYDTTRQEIIHEAECKEQFKIIEKEIVVEKSYTPTFYDRLSKWLPLILIIIVLLFIFRIVKRLTPT